MAAHRAAVEGTVGTCDGASGKEVLFLCLGSQTASGQELQ